MTKVTHSVGIAYLALGIATLLAINLADMLLINRSLHIGWRQFLGSVPAIALIGIGVILSRHWKHPVRGVSPRWLLVGGAFIAACSMALAWVVLEPGRGFRYDRTTGYERVVALIQRVGISHLSVCRCAPDHTQRIRLPGGFETLVAVYGNGKTARPGIVISHGNTWLGSSLSTYRLLATELARRGYVVATFDYPGFGQADNPFGEGPSNVAAAYDKPAILDAVIEYLIANSNVDHSNMTVFGHSGGVDWAMRAALRNPNVANVAVMVAPSPATFRGSKQTTLEYAASRSTYFSRRFAEQHEYVYGTKAPDWYDWELVQPNGRYSDDVFESYRISGHPSLLMILGQMDEPSGHDSELARFDAISQPKKLMLLSHSDHYLNTAQSLGFVFYDVRVARQIGDELAEWINQRGEMAQP